MARGGLTGGATGRREGWRRTLHSIRVQLALLIAALGLISGLVLAVLTIAGYREHSRTTALQLTETATALSQAMDGKVEEASGVLQALAKALAAQPRLEAGELQYFDRISRRMVEGVPDRWIVLVDDQGRRRVDTALPPGAPVPTAPPDTFQGYQQVGAGQAFYVSDLTLSPLLRRPVVGIVLPVPRPGRPTWRLAILLGPSLLQQILTAQGLPQNWLATLVDRRGRVIARSLHGARYLGRPIPPESLAGIAHSPKGVFEGRAFEGYSILAAYRRSPLTGWTLTVAMPRATAQAQLIRSLAQTVALELALSLLGVALVWRFGGRIARAVGRLAQAAEALGQGAPIAPPLTGLSETDAVGSALHDASIRLREREARIRRLVESNIIGVFFWTMAGEVIDANDAFLALVGYSREDLRARRIRWVDLTPAEWRDADRRTMDLIRAQQPTKPYEKEYIHKDGRRVPVLLGPAAYAGTAGEEGVAFVVDLTEQKETQQRLKLMVDELNHRVKNTLATVMAISAQTRRTTPSPDAFHQALQGRLAALSKTHNLLNESFWTGVTLRQLVEQALAPYAAGDRAVVEGGEVRLGPIVAVTLGMALYELASNAAKYGALSTPSGRVRVSWRPGAPGRLELEWAESGGPPVQAPERRGFGTQLIEKALAAELHGEVRLEFRPEGVRCVMETALDRLSAH